MEEYEGETRDSESYEEEKNAMIRKEIQPDSVSFRKMNEAKRGNDKSHGNKKPERENCDGAEFKEDGVHEGNVKGEMSNVKGAW